MDWILPSLKKGAWTGLFQNGTLERNRRIFTNLI
jgi:hypothetical protein